MTTTKVLNEIYLSENSRDQSMIIRFRDLINNPDTTTYTIQVWDIITDTINQAETLIIYDESKSVFIAYMIKFHKYTLEEVLQYLAKIKPGYTPNTTLTTRLKIYEEVHHKYQA
jgi:hypothetical protein